MVGSGNQHTSLPSDDSSPIVMSGSYQQLAPPPTSSSLQGRDDDEFEAIATNIATGADELAARRTFWNFVLMSILFSANHGCVVACLALATSRLGSIGAWQSGILYFTYTLSAVLGATWIVKQLGSRNAIMSGMALYCVYVACFWVATRFPDDLNEQRIAAYVGAGIGGMGAGFLWTSQGAYFGQASEEHATHLRQSVSLSTSYLAGVFAFLYLTEELLLRILSTVLVGTLSWESIFGVYTIVTVVSTMAMPLVHKYPTSSEDTTVDSSTSHNSYNNSTTFYKVTAAAHLLWNDPKMKYMIGLNAVFGFASSFLNSYVNGQVVPVALNDPNSRYIGLLSAWVSAVAAAMSLVFGRVAPLVGGKGPILIVGALCFLGVVLPFLIHPKAQNYGWTGLLWVYTLHGVGRATFEGTLKATFADFFSYEKEGAFANIILQNGLSGAIGYVLTFSLTCTEPSRYCIEYRNGSLHDVLTFELIVVVSAAFAILGYLRAAALFRRERRENHDSEPSSSTHTVDDVDEEGSASERLLTTNTRDMQLTGRTSGIDN